MGKEVTSDTIMTVVRALIGGIHPMADSALDAKVQDNLATWSEVTTSMVEDLADIANMETSGYASVDKTKQMAEEAVGALSDGYHTFDSLYKQRLYLFAALVNAYPDLSWKSQKHSDGKYCFDGTWFISGIDTPAGSYTYHFKLTDWDLFDCQELEFARVWDGHTEDDVARVLSLPKGNHHEVI